MAVQHPRVIVIGAGFAGLAAVRSLRQLPVEVILIDRSPFQTFSPLLHQVAAAQLQADALALPLRKVIQDWPNVGFVQAEVQQIDSMGQRVQANQTWLAYDFLIMATGSRPKGYGGPEVPHQVFTLKTLAQAVSLRTHLSNHLHRPEPWVIVGGGATGVELAASLADWIRRTNSPARVILLQRQPRLVPFLSERGSRYTYRRLTSLGVEVYLNVRVRQVTDTAVELQDGRSITTHTAIWTAGVEGQSIPGLVSNLRHQIDVTPSLVSEDSPSIYAVGDVAASGQPMLAPVAIATARCAVQNIARQLQGRQPLPFRYRHRLQMITLDTYAAVVQVGSLTITGFWAWLFWHLAHWWVLPSGRQRWLVGQSWGLQLIQQTPFLGQLYGIKQYRSKQFGGNYENSSSQYPCRSTNPPGARRATCDP